MLGVQRAAAPVGRQVLKVFWGNDRLEQGLDWRQADALKRGPAARTRSQAPKTTSGTVVCGGSAQAQNGSATTEKAKSFTP